MTTKRQYLPQSPDMTSKPCSACGEMKPIDQFYLSGNRRSDGFVARKSKCIACYRARAEEGREALRERRIKDGAAEAKRLGIPSIPGVPDHVAALLVDSMRREKAAARRQERAAAARAADRPQRLRHNPNLGGSL